MKIDESVLISGVTGFIGSYLFSILKAKSDFRVVPVVRNMEATHYNDAFNVDGIDGFTDYSEVIESTNVIIHLAGRAHIVRDDVNSPLEEYRKVNVEGTLNLARQAISAGVKRFIFISSINIHGVSFVEPFEEADALELQDPFSISKFEAEAGLRKLADESGMELVIIRPPLVYGPGVKANFLSLLKLSASGFPLPFGSVNNNRSMIYLGNLVDLIVRCIDHPQAANKIFLVSDCNDLSLRSLVTYIRSAMGRPPRLIPVPVWLFKLAGMLTGKRGVVERLVGDLQVDSSKARSLLSWTPPYTVEQGIAATVADFMNKDK